MQTKPTKLTVQELRERADIPPADRERVEAIVVRLIQIQDETKKLEAERGYTDPQGNRHPGLADELQDLYVKWDLGGVRIEDYQVLPSHGTSTRIDRGLLLAQGVPADEILAATVESHWTSVTVRKDKE